MADKNVSVLTSGSYTGSQTVREFEVTDLKVENGKLNGTAIGSVEKEGTGVVDKVKLIFDNVPFGGVGGKIKISDPEYIRLGTCSGGGSALSEGSSWYLFGGGGAIVDSKGSPTPLGEIIGLDTLVVDVLIKTDSDHGSVSLEGLANVRCSYGGGNSYKSIKAMTARERQASYGMEFSLIESSKTLSGYTGNFDVYAVCQKISL